VSATLHYAQTALATEPTFHSQRVRLGCATTAAHGAQRTLAWTEPSRELADLQAAFAASAAVDGVTLVFRGERAVILRIYENVRSGDLPATHLDSYLGGPPRAAQVTRYQRRLGGNSTVRDQAEVLRASSAFVAAARLSGPARRAACDDIEAGLSPGLTQFFRYARAAVEHDDVGRARLLCASVGLACERYRRQFGRWPATLAEVPASILPALPPDPLTGEAFAYQVLSDGAIVYSVSKVAHVRPGSTDEDVSILGWEVAAKFRLWNPESRRRPPRPDPTPEDEP